VKKLTMIGNHFKTVAKAEISAEKARKDFKIITGNPAERKAC
jgi:hypothetical protein